MHNWLPWVGLGVLVIVAVALAGWAVVWMLALSD